MHTALKERQVKGTTAAVCSVDESNKTVQVKKLEGFSKFHNFSFENKDIRVWRCYGIGSGKIVPYNSLIVQPQSSSSMVTKEPFFPIGQPRVLKPERKTTKEGVAVFVCPEPGCTKTFARFADFELHLDVGEHVIHKEPDQQHNAYDKIRRDWVGMFATVQTEQGVQKQSLKSSTCSQNEASVFATKMGWALPKTRSGSSQFSEKVKDYLTKKFDLGEKTGQKATAEQVAKDMRNARTLDNQKLFGRDEWLTKAQVQGFFSRLASPRKRRGCQGTVTSEEDNEEDDEEHFLAVEEVIEDLGLKHPIVFDVYNLCQYYEGNKLSSFSKNMLKDICRYFEIPFKSRDLKKDLLGKVS